MTKQTHLFLTRDAKQNIVESSPGSYKECFEKCRALEKENNTKAVVGYVIGIEQSQYRQALAKPKTSPKNG